jgi:hypothetical protein
LGNIIKMSTPLVEKEEFKEAMKLLEEMPQEKAIKIIHAMHKLLLLEVIINLGLEEAEHVNEEFGTSFDIDDDSDFIVSERIQKFYELKNRGCYFCDQSIDPNGDFFDDRTQVCPHCQLKLANILTYEGVDPLNKPYLPLVLKERRQKGRQK